MVNLRNYIGQEQLIKNLRTIVRAKRDCGIYDPPIDHLLFSGFAGLGKTTLAEIVAKELGCPLIKLMGPHLTDVNRLSFLKDIAGWSFVFIDEIHSLPSKVEEALYEPMDAFKWQGQPIKSFTLIGATTKEGLISKPLRSRFTIVERLIPYKIPEIREIVRQKATELKLTIDEMALDLIAQRAKGVPREAIQLLKRVSYYGAQITSISAQNALDSIGVDALGLGGLDRTILKTMRDGFAGGPVGIDSLANVAGEDVATIESKEPYLVQVGFIQRTGKGRILTKEGLQYVLSNEQKGE